MQSRTHRPRHPQRSHWLEGCESCSRHIARDSARSQEVELVKKHIPRSAHSGISHKQVATRSPIRVLIVEGVLPVHHGVGRSFGIVLRLHGYQARAVYSCRNAVAEVRRFKPHVVVIELLLDDMVGPELARRIRDSNRRVGIILYGGHAPLIEDYNRSDQLGDVFMILQKPIRPKTLLAEIERVTSGRNEVYQA
jgi:CheY-like chemotaxis protein